MSFQLDSVTQIYVKLNLGGILWGNVKLKGFKGGFQRLLSIVHTIA